MDSLIWEYEHSLHPEYIARTKIVRKSPPYGIPPVVVRSDMKQRQKESIRKVFLNAHKDAKGKGILKNRMIEKFVPIPGSAYDSIRAMMRYMDKRNAGGK